MARRRRGPTAQQLERMSMPSSNPFGYYLPFDAGVYDMSTCVPAYSDNKITPAMINAMIEEIHNHPDCQPSTCIFLNFIPFLGMPLLMIGVMMAATSMGDSTSLTIGIILLVAGFVLLIGGFCWVARRATAWMTRRNAVMAEIIARHKATTFSGLEVIIRNSTYQTYMAIEFAWKGMAQQGMMPMGMDMMQPGMIMVPAYQPQPQYGGAVMPGQQPFNPYQPAPFQASKPPAFN